MRASSTFKHGLEIFRSPLEFLDRVSAYLGEAQCIRAEAGEGADREGSPRAGRVVIFVLPIGLDPVIPDAFGAPSMLSVRLRSDRKLV